MSKEIGMDGFLLRWALALRERAGALVVLEKGTASLRLI